MVNMNDVEMKDPVEISKQEALKLGNEKVKLEEELKEWLSILTKNHVGMDEALIDADGFPRADIDVYQVRHARHRIICIKNDLRNIMKKIEEHLHAIHSENSSSLFNTPPEESVYESSIAQVTSVFPGSPAEEAGLQNGDSILRFGSIHASNFNNITDIASIVQHSVNQLIKIVIERDKKILKLYLKPHAWSGRGMLGCIILPPEQVER